MDVKIYMYETLTAAGNFSMQHAKSDCSRHISIFTKFASCMYNFPRTFPNITCNQNFVIVILHSFHGFSIVPLKNFVRKKSLSIGKNRTFWKSESEFLIKKCKISRKKLNYNAGGSKLVLPN